MILQWLSGGMIGDLSNIPEAEILTEEDLMKMNLDPSQFETVRYSVMGL